MHQCSLLSVNSEHHPTHTHTHMPVLMCTQLFPLVLYYSVYIAIYYNYSVYCSYVRIILEADASGQLPIRKIQKLMMVPKSSKEILDNLQSAKTNVQYMVIGRAGAMVAITIRDNLCEVILYQPCYMRMYVQYMCCNMEF